jgi:hypothetical protein
MLTWDSFAADEASARGVSSSPDSDKTLCGEDLTNLTYKRFVQGGSSSPSGERR